MYVSAVCFSLFNHFTTSCLTPADISALQKRQERRQRQRSLIKEQEAKGDGASGPGGWLNTIIRRFSAPPLPTTTPSTPTDTTITTTPIEEEKTNDWSKLPNSLSKPESLAGKLLVTN